MRMRQNKVFIAVEAFLIATMLCSGVYAMVRSTADVENEISIGAVNIELSHFTKRSDGEIEKVYIDEDIIGAEEISSIPRVTNMGIASYIRLAVHYYDADGDMAEKASVKDLASDWVEIDDYYYLTREAVAGESFDVFTSIVVPESWDDNNSEIAMVLKADAIQAANFSPDFSSNTPWGTIAIEDYRDEGYQIDSEEHTSAVTVSYEDEAEKYVSVPENFLARLNLLRPGDVIDGEITINNDDTEEHEIWISAGTSQSSMGNELTVRITRGGLVIYDGLLSGVTDFSLGKIAPGESDAVEISLSLPIEATNSVAGLSGTLNWSYRVDAKDDSVPDVPKTNDDIKNAMVIFLVSLVGLMVMWLIERRGQKEEE